MVAILGNVARPSSAMAHNMYLYLVEQSLTQGYTTQEGGSINPPFTTVGL